MRLHERLDAEAIALGLWDRPRAEVRDQLVEHYRPYAESCAERRRGENFRVARDDQYAAAMIGLWEAVQSFTPGRCAFTTWAYWRIRGELIEVERENDHFPAKVRENHNRGYIHLPAMGPLDETLDVAIEEHGRDDRMDELLHRAEPLVRGLTRLAVDSELDADTIAGRLGTSPYLAGHLVKWTVAQLQGTPVLI